MTPATRQALVGLLIAAATAVLALVIYSTFRRVLEPPDPDRVAARTDDLVAAAGTTTAAPTMGGGGGGGGGNRAGGNGSPPPAPEQTGDTSAGTDRPESGCQEPAPGNAQGTVVSLFFTCGTGPVPDVSGNAYRIVPATETRLTATLTELVQGPDAEERQLGFTSVFSDETSGIFGGVSIDDGTAVVDFLGLEAIDGLDRPTVANDLIASLNATVFQFDTVDAVEYRVGGSCQSFWATMGGDCVTTSRQEWALQLEAWEAEG